MQGAVFTKVLQMSLTGCYSIGIVLAVRLLLKRCGRVHVYYLWVLMFAGLCLPVSVPGYYSLIPGWVAKLSPEDVRIQENPMGISQGQDTGAQSREDSVQDAIGQERTLEEPPTALYWPAQEYQAGQLQSMPAELFPAQTVTEFPEDQKQTDALDARTDGRERMTYRAWAEKIWMLGILLLASYHLLLAYRMACRCSGYGQAEWKEGGWLVESEDVPMPFLWGFFRPVIYLPSGLKGEERKYILAHETVHRKRKDHLVKPLILTVTVLHWFNPLVWIACAMCFMDMEISCDEAVLGDAKLCLRRSYAESILKYAAKENRFLVSFPGFGEPSVKFRIRNVLHFRKKSAWISAAAGLCVIGVTAGLWHHPSGEAAPLEESARESETPPEGEAPAADEEEGRVINNGGGIIRVAGAYYYMDGMPLYSDGEALYTSVLRDDGTWHVCRYETDGSGFQQLFDGRIVDSTEYGQMLYCMFPAESGNGQCLGWYDTRTRETGRFSGEEISYLGKYAGYLYTSRQEADGLHIGRIREADLAEMDDPVKTGIPAESILKFYADEDRKRLIFAAEISQEETDSSGILCYSYDMESEELVSRELTGLPYFAMMDGYLYFQRYRSREDAVLELFRTDYEFIGEEQIGEGLELLRTEEETHTLLAVKNAKHPDFDYVNSLVRIWPDQEKEQMLLDMETMLPPVQSGKQADSVCLDWEFRPGDRVVYSELNLIEGQLYVTVNHVRGEEGTPLEEVHLTVNGQSGIGLWFPDELAPGWEDNSWLTETMVGQPIGMEAAGWDPEHAEDVRERFQTLPAEPDASERRKTYLLGETRYWTLYGKGDYGSMLLARNGRYTEIHHPYLSGYPMCPELMEADLDHDGITELVIRLNLKHGTGVNTDRLLLADFQNNGAWVYQFRETDFTEQLNAHLTFERTEHDLQAFIDHEPAGAPVEDEKDGPGFRAVGAGQLADFVFDHTEGTVRMEAELEFYDPDSPGMAEYNGCAVTADVVWTGAHFILENTECIEHW